MTNGQGGAAAPVTSVIDGLAPVPFNGYLLAEVTNERPMGPRWLNLHLWRAVHDDGTPGPYYLHSVGVSVVYHARNSTCNKGVPMRAGDLPEDAEPCGKCQPPAPDLMDRGQIVDMESDRHTAHKCDTPEAVIAQLKVGPGRVQGRLSGPAQRLVEIAGAADPDIRRAATAPVTL